MIEEVLDALGAPAHAELVEERQELMRFGESRLAYQHSEERTTLRARIVRDGREVWGILGAADSESVHAFRDRLEAIAAALPRDEVEPFGADGAARPARTAFEATERAEAGGRIGVFHSALDAIPAGATLGGSIAHVTARHAVGNTDGVRREETRTRAAVQLVATLDGRSSWARAIHRDADALAVADVAAGMEPLPDRPLSPGRYRAVLAPQAVATLLAAVGQVAFADGAPAAGGLGTLGENVTIVDDGCDEDGLPSTFDCMGTAKQRVPLVERGVVREVVRRETGHAVPPAWRFGAGPAASHLLLAAGDADDAGLLAACGEGLSIQRLDYVRVAQPRRTLVTGSSRDATRWVAGGEVVARVPQFRFTLRLDELFRAFAAVGSRRERAETPFMESVVAPGVAVESFPVDQVTHAAP